MSSLYMGAKTKIKYSTNQNKKVMSVCISIIVNSFLEHCFITGKSILKNDNTLSDLGIFTNLYVSELVILFDYYL